MVNYNSKDKVYSGVPLGGIGAGKLEIFPDGTFGSITIKNNWPTPLGYRNPKVETSHTEHVPGFHMAVRTKYNNRTAACLLQAVPLSNYPTTERISYHGEYPFTKITYYPKNVPVVVKLEAFSPLILGDVGNSSYPGILFNFELKNKSKKRADLSLLFIFRNIIGNYPTGRYNLVKKAPVSRTILFTQDNPHDYDHTYGYILYKVVSPWGRFTHHNGWNMCSQNFKFDAASLSLPFWRTWVEKGELPDIDSKIKVNSGSYELGTAINVFGTIKAKGRVQLKAVLAWDFQRHPYLTYRHKGTKAQRHKVNSTEKNVITTSQHLLKNASNLKHKTLKWQNIIKQSSMPVWLVDALINNLYVLSSGSISTKDGKFALFEAPVECPYLGTLDVRFYGSLPLALLFPELEKAELLQFAQAQRPDGYIPHDFGWNRMDSPTDGTTMLRWKDLCPKFILMVSRYWLWHKDNMFLEDMYPVCKRAMLWELNTDKNNDYLPDNEGTDQTFDLWQFYGTNSYTSSIYLASLLALAKMAKHVGDEKFSRRLTRVFSLAQRNFISILWSKSYFMAANDKKKKLYRACTANQLIGQWFSHMIQMGYILPEWYVKNALKTVMEFNANVSRHGAVNSVYPESKIASGRIDSANSHAGNVWPGISYSLSALAIYEGMIEEGLALAKKVWDNIVHNQKSPWNQPDVIDTKTGAFGFGDHYMRNMVIWAVPLALSRYDQKVAKMFKLLSPPLS